MLFNHKKGREVGRKGWAAERTEWSEGGRESGRTGERKDRNAKPRTK